jgi:hypothetical protein
MQLYYSSTSAQQCIMHAQDDAQMYMYRDCICAQLYGSAKIAYEFVDTECILQMDTCAEHTSRAM